MITINPSIKVNKELLNSRFHGQGCIDSAHNCLRRAQGLAGIIIDLTSMAESYAGGQMGLDNLGETVSAIDDEITQALLLIDDYFKQASNAIKESHDA